MAKYFLKFMNTIAHRQNAEWIPNKRNKRKPNHIIKPRYIIIKLLKTSDKVKILKAVRGKKNIEYRGTMIRVTAEFSSETMQAMRQCNDNF